MESRKNDLKAFKAYLEEQRTQEGQPLNTAVSGVQYTYTWTCWCTPRAWTIPFSIPMPRAL